MYRVWLGNVPVLCDHPHEVMALCDRWRKLQNLMNDLTWTASMHQPVFAE